MGSSPARLAAAGLAVALVGFAAPAYASPGSTATAAPLTVPRDGFAVASLADGRVLVTGGDTTTLPPYGVPEPGTAEVYDPLTNTWRATAPYAHERLGGATATTLADGRVLVAGGQYASAVAPPNDAIYHPGTDTWTPVPRAPGGRRGGHAAVRLADGRVLVAGGHADVPGSAIFDPASGAWQDAPATLGYHPSADAVVLGDGTVLLAGGGSPSEAAPVERFDPVTETWRVVPMPPGWELEPGLATSPLHAAALPGGALLVGDDGRALVFSTETGRLRDGGRTATPREFSLTLTALPTGEVLLSGGRRPWATQEGAELEVYDPRTDLWRDGAAVGDARRYGGAALTGSGDVLLVAGTADRRRVDRYTPPPATPAPPGPVGQAATLTTHLQRDSGSARATLGVVAHLRGADSGLVSGETVRLYSRPAGAAAWTLVGEALTDAHGAAAFSAYAPATTAFAARHAGTLVADAAAAAAVTYTAAAPGPPGPPERVIAESANASARVSWLPPEDDGGSAVTGYTVRATTYGSGPEPPPVSVSASTRTVTITGLANGDDYLFEVIPRNASGAATTPGWSRATPRSDAPPLRQPPVGGTHVCGRLPYGRTQWTLAGSPYHVCPLGLIVGAGSSLHADGADVRFRGPSDLRDLPRFGLAVRHGGLRLAATTLRGERGVPGEWAGVATDPLDTPSNVWAEPGVSGATVEVSGSQVRHGVDALDVPRPVTLLLLSDLVLADATGLGLRTFEMPFTARNLTIRSVGGDGVAVTCRHVRLSDDACPVTLDGVTVDRAGGRGLLVDATGPVRVRNPLVVGSGNGATRAEAARFSAMTGSYGPGGDIEEVRGGGNGVDAVVLDLTMTNDLVWRTPVAGSAAVPLPLGYVVGALRLAPGRNATFPAGSVVKGTYTLRPGNCAYVTGSDTCAGGVDVTEAVLDASAPGSTFTSAADNSVGVTTCPSTLARACGTSRQGWLGLSARGATSRVTLTGATVRDAMTGLRAAGGANQSGPGPFVSVAGTAFASVMTGIVAGDSYRRGGTVTLSDVTVDDSWENGIYVHDVSSADLRDVAVRGGHGGLIVYAGDSGPDCARTSVVSLAGIAVSDTRYTGVQLGGLCRPLVRDVVVRRTGLPDHNRPIGWPAVSFSGTASFGPGGDVSGLTGGGNGLDAVSISGDVTGDLTWVTPSNAPGDHPLGHLVGGDVTVRGARFTVPAGAVVGSLGGGMSVVDGAFDASAGGARFVPVTDRTAPGFGCVAACPAGGFGHLSVSGGTLALDAATVRGGNVTVTSGTARVTRTESDGGLVTTGADAVTVTDSRLPSVRVMDAGGAVDLRRNHVHDGDWGPALEVRGRGTATPLTLTMRDNVVAPGQKMAAYRLSNLRATFGATGSVHGNIASGNDAVVVLSGVLTDADFDWVSPTNEPTPHVAGYALTDSYATYPAPALTVDGPRTLRLPRGAVLKAQGEVRLAGASLDATAGGALLTRVNDSSAGADLCRWAPCEADPETTTGWTSETFTVRALPDRTTGELGRVALTGARVYGSIVAEGPRAAGASIALDQSYVKGRVAATGSAAAVTRTVSRDQGIGLTRSTGSVVRDVDVVAGGVGVLLEDAQAEVTETAVTGTSGQPHSPVAGIRLRGQSGGTFSCLDVRGNANGFAVAGPPVTVSDSTLTGNTPPDSFGNPRHDLANEAAVTTTGVWWGQPGGPVAGQVRDPARHADLAPRSAAPACAVAEAAAPPGVPRGVGASAGPSSLVVTWQPPSSDGRSPVTAYRVTVGATTVEVPGSARTATVGGLAPGSYAATVSAVNAVGESARSRFTAPVTVGSGGTATPTPSVSPTASKSPTASPSPTVSPSPTRTPSPTPTGTASPTPSPSATPPARASATLSVSAPPVVTYGTDAVVTGRLATAAGPLPGRTVRVYVRRAGGTSWGGAVGAATTSPTGAVTFRLRFARNVEVQLRYGGDETTTPAFSAVRTVAVRPTVSLALSRSTVPPGTTVALTGSVAPNLAGRKVLLERKTADGWQLVTWTYLTSASGYRFTVTWQARGTYPYRVVYSATADYARAVSATRTLTVS